MTETRAAICTSCGEEFTSTREKKSRPWRRTCGPPCRLAAIDRMIANLQRARDRLAAEIDPPEIPYLPGPPATEGK